MKSSMDGCPPSCESESVCAVAVNWAAAAAEPGTDVATFAASASACRAKAKVSKTATGISKWLRVRFERQLFMLHLYLTHVQTVGKSGHEECMRRVRSCSLRQFPGHSR